MPGGAQGLSRVPRVTGRVGVQVQAAGTLRGGRAPSGPRARPRNARAAPRGPPLPRPPQEAPGSFRPGRLARPAPARTGLHRTGGRGGPSRGGTGPTQRNGAQPRGGAGRAQSRECVRAGPAGRGQASARQPCPLLGARGSSERLRALRRSWEPVSACGQRR